MRESFKGKDMIVSLINRIKSFQARGHLDLHGPPPQSALPLTPYLARDATQPGVKPAIDTLNEQTSGLSVRLYGKGVDSECAFDCTCAIIAIECSQTLSPGNNISCVLLAVPMANAFGLLEISYSVVVFADFNFQFVIKSFEEGHSQQMIQRILDATIADRFVPRIA
jgi:hypothetical protein